MPITTYAELVQAVSSTSSGTIELGHGDIQCDDEIVIENKSDFTIRGQGQKSTTLKCSRDGIRGPNCLRIGSNVHNLTLADFGIVGNIESDEDANSPHPGFPDEKHLWPLRGIGCQDVNHAHPIDVSNVLIRDMELSYLTTGVQVATINGTIAGSTIRNTFIHHIYGLGINGEGGGVGYGIHVYHAPGMTIRDNVIHRASRHSIYLSENQAGAWSYVIGNILVDGGTGQAQWVVATIARSSNVTVAHNLFVRSRTWALGVEKVDDGNRWDPKNIQVIDNHFIDSDGFDIWINTGTDPSGEKNNVLWWHNTAQNGSSTKFRPNLESGSTFEPALWSGTEKIDRVGESLHVIQNGTLHLVKPNYDRLPITPQDWPYTVLK